ncbi:SgcJ/EcaC family oxidoreductase [Saccharothrix sp. S26]|uniref:SgcJ/EcaC family oxidoreductase n=1 Tax=Saccharothrix sp. S26 TaxID=2907215 RepID=UPI001F3EEC6D|nr:SgcJ/EcaC family oxidoreductase [Saccharothrix sp. S26]MCE7000732.1 SgcJ/EcaC family oxidoreductase [Saccharothrix sp. S26]
MSNVGRVRAGAIAAVTLVVALTACGTAVGTEQSTTATTTATTGTTAVAEPSAQEVQALFGDWNRALATGDPERVADHYAPDGVLLPTLSDNVRSDRAEIVDYFEHFLANKPSGEILESHVAVLGPDAAIDAGVYRFTFAADGTQVDARYTFAYERVDGKWLIVNHHSSAMPGKP